MKKYCKRSDKLGSPFSTEYYNMVRNILFHLVQKNNKDYCYRCGDKIETVDKFSIEHIVNWRLQENAEELFFDYKNISYSHLTCNSKAVNYVEPSLEIQKTKALSNSSGFKGVYYYKKRNIYISRFVVGGKKVTFGNFKNALEAAKCTDLELIKIHGEDAITNKKMGLY